MTTFDISNIEFILHRFPLVRLQSHDPGPAEGLLNGWETITTCNHFAQAAIYRARHVDKNNEIIFIRAKTITPKYCLNLQHVRTHTLTKTTTHINFLTRFYIISLHSHKYITSLHLLFTRSFCSQTHFHTSTHAQEPTHKTLPHTHI